MSTTETGRRAEQVAADFLRRKGCEIVAQNWRTRACEIDIVAKRQDIMFFCEVKYRVSARHGSGLDYITPKKVRQMRFAAETWVQTEEWPGGYQLCVIELTGPDFRITKVIRDIE